MSVRVKKRPLLLDTTTSKDLEANNDFKKVTPCTPQHSSYLQSEHCTRISRMLKRLKRRTRDTGRARETVSLRELINLHIVVINPVSNRKLPASTREPNRRFPFQLCISMWTILSYTGGAPQISTSFRIFNDTLRRYNNFDDEAQTLCPSIQSLSP